MDIDQVVRRWLAGEKIQSIARLTGWGRNTVRRIVRLAEGAGIRGRMKASYKEYGSAWAGPVQLWSPARPKS